MWITQDERRLLRGYYDLVGDIQAEQAFRLDDLGLLLTLWGYRKSQNMKMLLHRRSQLQAIRR